MATIKGQNLRVVYEEECVAMATSCQLHLSLETAEISSKDDDDGWAQVIPVGVSWDVTVDALVTDGWIINKNVGTTDAITQPEQGSALRYIDPVLIHLREGDVLNLTPSAQTAIVGLVDPDQRVITEGTAGTRVSYTCNQDEDVYIAKSNNSGSVLAQSAYPGNYVTSFLNMYGSNGKVASEQLGLYFTIGTRNQETDTEFVIGMAVIEDISINATNRQVGTYTVRFRGTGELTIGDL